MPLDPAAKNVLDLLASMGAPPLEEQTPQAARESFAGLALLGGDGADVASVVPGTFGGVPGIVVTPHGEGPYPVLVWIHGGGWVIGSATESLATANDLAAGAGCVVVSLDYRLAPEHKAPAAVDDCIAATAWVLEHAAESPPTATRRAATSRRSSRSNSDRDWPRRSSCTRPRPCRSTARASRRTPRAICSPRTA